MRPAYEDGCLLPAKCFVQGYVHGSFCFVLCVYACVHYPVYCLIKLLSTLQFNKYRDIAGKSKATNSLNQPFKFPVISNINFHIQNVGLSLNLKFRKPCPYQKLFFMPLILSLVFSMERFSTMYNTKWKALQLVTHLSPWTLLSHGPSSISRNILFLNRSSIISNINAQNRLSLLAPS